MKNNTLKISTIHETKKLTSKFRARTGSRRRPTAGGHRSTTGCSWGCHWCEPRRHRSTCQPPRRYFRVESASEKTKESVCVRFNWDWRVIFKTLVRSRLRDTIANQYVNHFAHFEVRLGFFDSSSSSWSRKIQDGDPFSVCKISIRNP